MSKKISLTVPDKERPNLLSLFHEYMIRKVKEDREAWKRAKRSGKIIWTTYGDEYDADMARLRYYYGHVFGDDSYIFDDEDDEWDDDDYDDDYYVDDDGTIVYPPPAEDDDNERTLRPYERRHVDIDEDEYWNKMKKLNGDGKYKHTKHRGSRGSKKAKVIDINTPYSGDEENPDEYDVGTVRIYYYPDYHKKFERIEFNTLAKFDKYCEEMGFKVPQYVAEVIAYASMSHCCLNPVAKEYGELEIMREDSYGDMYYQACNEEELSQ